MNPRTLLIPALAASLAISLGGCAGADARPPLADTWGLSVRMAVESQKLDPRPKDDRPVTGLDGVFAKNALDAYRKSAEPDANGEKDKLPEAIILTKKGAK